VRFGIRFPVGGSRMVSPFTATCTMFVLLKGHDLLESYFSVPDCRHAANDAQPGGNTRRLESPSVEWIDRHGWD